MKAHEASREWRLAGKPRYGPVFQNKRVTNAQYKDAICFIKNNEEAMKVDSMARKCSNTFEFWKEVRAMKTKVSLPCVGVSGAVAAAVQ